MCSEKFYNFVTFASLPVKFRSKGVPVSALGGGDWSASRPGHLTPKERASGNHWLGGWAPEPF